MTDNSAFAEECLIFGFKLHSEARARGGSVDVFVKYILPVLRQELLNGINTMFYLLYLLIFVLLFYVEFQHLLKIHYLIFT